MTQKKKKNNTEGKSSAGNEYSEYAKKTGLSMDELKIISEMLKESLVDEINQRKGYFAEIKTDFNQADNNIEIEPYYEGDEESEYQDYDIEAFRANSPVENFYAVNDSKECPMCGSKINKFGNYSLEFGNSIRKKANFCGIDCLKEFIHELSFTKGF